MTCRALVFAVVLTACGGESQGGSNACVTESCGGDPVGTWAFESMCVDHGEASRAFGMGVDTPACSDALRSASGRADATYVFDADGTRSVMGTGTMSMSVRLTERCFSELGGQQVTLNSGICSALGDSLADQSDPTTPFSSATCNFNASACNCTVEMGLSLDDSGTYRVDGDRMIDDTTGEAQGFCVDGDTMHLETDAGSITVTR